MIAQDTQPSDIYISGVLIYIYGAPPCLLLGLLSVLQAIDGALRVRPPRWLGLGLGIG